MSVSVNLLLLLSALLSALTGAGVGVRAPQPAVSVARAAAPAVAMPARVARVVGVPMAALPTLTAAASGSIARAWRLAAAAPLYLSRRRE